MAHATNLDSDALATAGWFSTSLGGADQPPLFRLVEIPAAVLVVAEIIVLLAGILARYVFHKPHRVVG